MIGMKKIYNIEGKQGMIKKILSRLANILRREVWTDMSGLSQSMVYARISSVGIIAVMILALTLVFAGVSYAVTVGPNSPTNGTTDASDSTFPWTINSSADQDANDNTFSTNVPGRNNNTNYLLVQNFGFAVPGGATIDGITVEISWKEGGLDATNTVEDNEIWLIRADNTYGNAADENKTTNTDLPTTEAYRTYGGAADAWGANGYTWTDTDINSLNFGVAIKIRGRGNGATDERADVDHVRITVDYTPAVPCTRNEERTDLYHGRRSERYAFRLSRLYFNY
jgi:hypothetical protein